MLRPYQLETIANVKRDLFEKHHTDVLAVLATGLGKTQVFLQFVIDMLTANPTHRALILVHRAELAYQPVERIATFWPEWKYRTGIVMADLNETRRSITVATVQTLSSERRLQQLLVHGAIDYLVTDECFPAGTLIDGLPIEQIRVGHTIRSFNHTTNQIEYKPVTKIFRKPVQNLVRVVLDNGTSIVCTPNHPYYVSSQDKYISADRLAAGDMLYCTIGNHESMVHNVYQSKAMRRMWHGVHASQLEPVYGADLLQAMQRYSLGASAQKGVSALCAVRHNRRMQGTQRITAGAQGQGVLFGSLQAGLDAGSECAHNGGDESQVRIRAYEAQQSNVYAGHQREDDCQEQGQNISSPWWQWTSNKTADRASIGTWVADGTRHTYQACARAIRVVARFLQSRYSRSFDQVSDRSGRQNAQTQEMEVSGQAQNSGAKCVRVVRVEVLERGDRYGFGSLCPDGYVYNIEVADNHNYFVSDILVHNCHHANATSYLALVAKLRAANPNLKHLGVTATPLRADGDGLSKVFQHCSHKVSIKDGVKGRYLVPVKALAISTKISLRGVKSAQGDFVQSQLKHVFETDNCLDLVVATHQKYAAERQAICFTVSVEGAHTLAEKFNEAGISSAAIDGTTAKEERKCVLRSFQAGEIKVLCNCMVLTEGFDAPAINAVHMVRPTKSDSLYVQCIGRGLRPAPEKEDCLIFDYAPAETRNIVMAGDVLGVPAEIKKEQDKAQDELEQGDAFAGFTFDGEARGVEGDPLELVARELNYLDITPYAWQKNEGYLTLSIKQGKTLVITPLKPNQDAQNLLLVTSEKGRPPHVDQLLDGAFADLTDYAQAYADEHGDPVFQAKDRSWRKRGVTEKQIELLRKFGFRNDTIFKMTASDASAVIGWRFTKQALRNARWLY